MLVFDNFSFKTWPPNKKFKNKRGHAWKYAYRFPGQVSSLTFFRMLTFSISQLPTSFLYIPQILLFFSLFTINSFFRNPSTQNPNSKSNSNSSDDQTDQSPVLHRHPPRLPPPFSVFIRRRQTAYDRQHRSIFHAGKSSIRRRKV